MRGGVLALHLPGQACQPIQQCRLGIAVGKTDGMGQGRQIPLGRGQYGSGLAGCRQAQQGRHAVGLDLQQPLHQPPQAAWRQ